MKKTLVALAALAATSAFAQSSVTISGFGNLSYDLFSVSQGKAAAARTGNKSEDRVTDNSGRIIFSSNEDLGGGMNAIWQVDLRPLQDGSVRLNALCATPATPAVVAQVASTGGAVAAQPAVAAVAAGVCNPGVSPLAGGNSHIGLSSSMGAIRLGRQDIHYTEGGNFAPVSQPTIHGHNGFLVAANGVSVGRTTRTSNLIWYTSPTMNGVTATVGYSTSGTSASGTVEVENDMASAQRKGSTQYARLGYAQGPITAVVSYINEKADYVGVAGTTAASGLTDGGAAAVFAAANGQADRSGTIVSFKYDLGVAKLGVAVANNNSKAMSAGVAGAASKRTNTQYGIGIPMGASNFAITQTKVGTLKTSGADVANSGATAVGLVYSYDLSKRTQLFAGMTTITNQSAATQGLFYNSDNAVGSAGSGAIAGEKHSVTSFGLRHSF